MNQDKPIVTNLITIISQKPTKNFEYVFDMETDRAKSIAAISNLMEAEIITLGEAIVDFISPKNGRKKYLDFNYRIIAIKSYNQLFEGYIGVIFCLDLVTQKNIKTTKSRRNILLKKRFNQYQRGEWNQKVVNFKNSELPSNKENLFVSDGEELIDEETYTKMKFRGNLDKCEYILGIAIDSLDSIKSNNFTYKLFKNSRFLK